VALPRLRKPLQLHRLHGTHRTTRHRDRHEAPGGPPLDDDPPAWLSHGARPVWREVLQIAPTGILRRADEHLVGVYAEQMARYRLALAVQRALDTEGQHSLLLCDDEGRPRALSPLVRELRALEGDLIKAGNRFGFSPTSRAQLSAPPVEDEVETDAFTQEFGRLRVIPGGQAPARARVGSRRRPAKQAG
jgi:P27 family predicted phage terminase small subunit